MTRLTYKSTDRSLSKKVYLCKFLIVISRKVSSWLKLGLKAKIRSRKSYLGYGFDGFSENSKRTGHNTLYDVGRKTPPGEMPNL